MSALSLTGRLISDPGPPRNHLRSFAGGPQHGDRGAGEVVVEVFDRAHQVTVDGGLQGSWERFGEAWQVGEEEQWAGGLAGPSPRRDFFEEDPQIDDVVMELDG